MGRTNNHTNRSTYEWKTDIIVYKDKCFECGVENVTIHFHHIIPEIRGGSKTIPLCPTCHGLVHNRNFDHHRELQRLGIEKAKLLGKYKGRKTGTKEEIDSYLTKDRTKQIIELLNNGYGPRAIMRLLKCSPNSIYKVRKYIKNQNVQEQ